MPQGPVRLPARHAHHRPLWHPPLRQVVVVRKTVVEPRRRGFSEERAVRNFKFRKNNQFTNTACSRPPPAIRTRLCAYAAIGLYAAARHAAAESHWVTRRNIINVSVYYVFSSPPRTQHHPVVGGHTRCCSQILPACGACNRTCSRSRLHELLKQEHTNRCNAGKSFYDTNTLLDIDLFFPLILCHKCLLGSHLVHRTML